MATVTMVDTIGLPDVAQMPAGTKAVGAYVDNLSLPAPMPNYNAAVAKYVPAGLVVVPITAVPGSATAHLAKAIDCETGDYTPAQAAALAAETGAAIYATASNQPPGSFQRWLAQWDGVAELPAGYVAKQYASGEYFDLNVADTTWLGLDPAPAPAPDPTVHWEDDVVITSTNPSGGEDAWSLSPAGKLTHVWGKSLDATFTWLYLSSATAETLPGTWQDIIAAGWLSPTRCIVTGIGTDGNCYWTGWSNGVWSEPVKVA